MPSSSRSLRRLPSEAAESPVPFDELWERAQVMRIGEADVRVASIGDLVGMKQAVGRPRDLEDVERLREIEQERERSDD